MFMVLSSWEATSRVVHPVHMMNMEQHQAAADPQPRPNDPGCESGCQKPHTPHCTLVKELAVICQLPLKWDRF